MFVKWESSILQELLLCPLSFFSLAKCSPQKCSFPEELFQREHFAKGNNCSLNFLSVLFDITGSKLLVATSTDSYYFRKTKMCDEA